MVAEAAAFWGPAAPVAPHELLSYTIEQLAPSEQQAYKAEQEEPQPQEEPQRRRARAFHQERVLPSAALAMNLTTALLDSEASIAAERERANHRRALEVAGEQAERERAAERASARSSQSMQTGFRFHE